MAPLVVSALVISSTLEHADSLVAAHAPGAGGVGDTGGRDPDALHLGVAGEAGRAGALLAVVLGVTDGVDAARVGQGAPALALAAVTALSILAVTVIQAAN